MVGSIVAYAATTAPAGYLLCDGTTYEISAFPALAALLGTNFGGDGVTTFAVPDLRSRFVVGVGAGANLSTYTLGEAGGVEGNTVVPAHTHALNVFGGLGDQETPVATVAAGEPNLSKPEIYSDQPPNAIASTAAIATSGSASPVENRPPFIALAYIIASS
jgi:microcystin-dependent protein